MTNRLKTFHKKNSELQKFKTNIKKFVEYRKSFFLKDINETIEKLKLSDKDKELLRLIKELEKWELKLKFLIHTLVVKHTI